MDVRLAFHFDLSCTVSKLRFCIYGCLILCLENRFVMFLTIWFNCLRFSKSSVSLLLWATVLVVSISGEWGLGDRTGQRGRTHPVKFPWLQVPQGPHQQEVRTVVKQKTSVMNLNREFFRVPLRQLCDHIFSFRDTSFLWFCEKISFVAFSPV